MPTFWAGDVTRGNASCALIAIRSSVRTGLPSGNRSASLHREVGVSSVEMVFVCALSLLGRSPAQFPSVQFVEKAPAGVSPLAAAYVNPGRDPHIVIITSTSAFLAARSASPVCHDVEAIREIAGVLVHEEWHERHGADEEGAYDAQLTALLSMGANDDDALFHKVKKAKLAVLAGARRASHAIKLARDASPHDGP